jgi:hypothetical protein
LGPGFPAERTESPGRSNSSL